MSFTITCPNCGPRNAYEFGFGGENKGPRPDENNLSVEDWCDFVHMNRCIAGVSEEWWVHRSGCGVWFTTSRNTMTNQEVPAGSGVPESNRPSENE